MSLRQQWHSPLYSVKQIFVNLFITYKIIILFFKKRLWGAGGTDNNIKTIFANLVTMHYINIKQKKKSVCGVRGNRNPRVFVAFSKKASNAATSAFFCFTFLTPKK